MSHTAQDNINPRSRSSGMERQKAPPHLGMMERMLD